MYIFYIVLSSLRDRTMYFRILLMIREKKSIRKWQCSEYKNTEHV